jgi:hypothetical protein
MKTNYFLLKLAAWSALTVDYYARASKHSPIGKIKWKLYEILDHLKPSLLSSTVKLVVEIDASNYSFSELKKLTRNFVCPVVIRGLFSQTEAVKKWSSPTFWIDNYGEQEFLVYEKGLIQDQLQDVVHEKQTGDQSSFARAVGSKKLELQEIIQRMLEGENLYVNNLDTIFRENQDLLVDLEIPNRITQWWEGAHKPLNPPIVQMFMGVGKKEEASLTTGSPLHCARHANFFVQVVGTKKWTLIEPKYSLFLHPILAYNIPGCISETFPSVIKTLPRQEVILQPGDALFNPPWMWHQVENRPGFTIGCATRELRFWVTLKNNPMFTILQEFTEMNSHFSPRASESRIRKFFVSMPLFAYGVALLQESIKGYVKPPIRTYGKFDEHTPKSNKSFDYLERIQKYHQNKQKNIV